MHIVIATVFNVTLALNNVSIMEIISLYRRLQAKGSYLPL